MLLCPVRDCHLALSREEKRVLCPRAHSFDVARSGYINLLQPQDRRSKDPGDTAATVAARRRLHDRGVTEPLLRGIAEMLVASQSDIVLDAGCGDGFYLGALARQTGCAAHGVDISTRAIDLAARRFPPDPASRSPLGTAPTMGVASSAPRYEWIVANADRFLPYAEGSFSIVLSITGRMNTGEFRRVLRDDGRLLVAIPSPDDLKELRSRTGEEGRDRVARTIETFAKDFTRIDQRRVTTTADLAAGGVRDVLVSIYRPLRAEPVEAMRVTFSLDMLLFRVA